jgi:hypothetical protein
MGPYAGADYNLTLSDTAEVQLSTPTMTNADEFFSNYQPVGKRRVKGGGGDHVSSW